MGNIMSIINDALYNLQQHTDNAEKISAVDKRPAEFVERTVKPARNFLILLVSFVIMCAIFVLTYTLNFEGLTQGTIHYFRALKENSVAVLKQVPVPIAAKKIQPMVKNSQVTQDIQENYYQALDFLNEGNDNLAKQKLTLILEQNPNFQPAQQALNMLKSR